MGNELLEKHFNSEDGIGDSSWIALSAFAKYRIGTSEIYNNENYLNNENVHIVVRFSDIDHIEVF